MVPSELERKKAELREGERAPDFKLLSDEGKEVSLEGLRGRKVILYFYPKDDTPGCTKEACSFRDGLKATEKLGVCVLGVSVDSVDSHRMFREKYRLNFPLLSDEKKEVVSAYGVWKEKSLYGRQFMGIERTTFLIDERGKIVRIFPKVKVEGHLEEVLEALRS